MRCETIYLKDVFPQLGADGCNATLDTYIPYPMTEMGWDNRKRPCILICPGGGYGMVSKREAEPIALKFLEAGYNAFVVTYSVAPHRFPQQLLEVAAAMELIYQNAEEWHCDVTKIAITGFSAGGHLAAHYTNAYDCPEVRSVFPDSKPVQASILGYPVITSDRTHAHQGSFLNLLGEYPADDDVRFSCEKLVSEKTPPAFLWHTAEDSCVPVENSLLYAAALSRYKIPFELHIYPYGWHGLATADGMSNEEDALDMRIRRANEWLENVKRWLKILW